jgi:hypothetical protein
MAETIESLRPEEWTIIMTTDFYDQQTCLFLVETSYVISKSMSERKFPEMYYLK